MTLRKFWPVAILFAAVLVYFWVDEDESVSSKKTQQEPFAETPPITAPATTLQPPPMWDDQSIYQAPGTTPGTRPYGYTQSAQNGRFQSPLSGQYQFRPEGEKDSTAKRFSDPYGRPSQDQRYVKPAPVPQGYTGTGIVKAPDETTNYRFRPLDKKRQSKRWEGNYARKPIPRYQPANPYPYENYPPPLNQLGPTAENNSLWADSWPGR